MTKNAIALGGGAPNLTLMTGALLALDEAGVDFTAMTTTGAGMVAGLLYMAPRRESASESWVDARRRALRATREMGIDDLIYDQFPVNYKIFQKSGKMAEAYSDVVNPTIWAIPRETRRQRLLGDTLGLFAAMMQPGHVSPESAGLCQPPPWIDLIVDFEELGANAETAEMMFSLSAYCIEDKREHHFNAAQITRRHFEAGLAMPFLYSPYKMKDHNGDEKTYLEGSAIRTMQLNPGGIMDHDVGLGIDTLIYCDLMGNRHLLAEPKNIIDAWGRSIVAPLTQLAYLQEQILFLKGSVYNINKLSNESLDILDQFALDVEEDIEDYTAEVDTPAARALADKFKRRAKSMMTERVAVYNNIRASLKELTTDRVDADDMQSFFGELLESLEGDKEVTDGEDGDPVLALLGAKALIGQEIEHIIKMGGENIWPDQTRMLRMPFRNNLKKEDWPTVLDWSHSNMSKLFDIGHDTACAFVDEHWRTLGLDSPPKG